MSEAATITLQHRRRVARPQTRSRVKALHGERLAVAMAAIAVAALPLLAPHGPANSGPEDVLIGLALVGFLLWAGTSGHRLRFAFGIPMALFIGGGALGALAGPVPDAGLTAIVQDMILLAWCWAFINIASSAHRLKVLLSTWVYSSIGWATLLFIGLGTGVTFLSGQTTREGSRTALTFGDPNVCANYFVISIMLLWATGRPRRRALRFGAYGLLLAALLSTGSNSGMVSVLVATVVATVVGIERKAGVVPALTASAFILVGGFLLVSNLNLKSIQQKAYASPHAFIRDGLGRGEVSVDQRATLLHESVGLYEAGGPLGTGPVSTKPRLAAELAPFVKEAHNDYSAALTERGVIGAVGLLLLMSGLIVRSFSLAKTRLTPAFAAVVLKPNAIIGALAGTMVAETVYELLHVRQVWTLFAIVAGLVIWGRD